jgi:prevent-host-death family protein
MDEATVGSFKAKTHLPELLRRVERGETITITKHGKPVAKLVPAVAGRAWPGVRESVEAMKRFQREEGPALGSGLTVRDLIEAGRRY